ncbi:MAG: glycosyltransferase family 87 protein [Rhizomicrobium sp.]
MGFCFAAVTAVVYLWLMRPVAPIPRDPSGLVVGRDFLNFWMYGKAALSADPARWYDLAAYQQELTRLLGNGYPGQNWSYPPTIMLLAAPFGLMAYMPALVVWTVLGLSLLLLSLRGRASGRVVVATLVSPAAIFCLISGQSEIIVTALLVAAYAWRDKRPVLAGILIGLLTLKPHLGLLLPLALAASGRWRVFAAATLTALLLAGISVLSFGTEAWLRFFTLGIPAQNQVLADVHGIATPFYPTIFMNLRGAGMSYGVAMTVQVAFACLGAMAVGLAFRRKAGTDPRLAFALLLAATVTALPYLLIYSTLPLCLAALLLLEDNMLDAPGRILASLVYWLPLLQIGLGTLHVPGPALIPALFLLYLVKYRPAMQGVTTAKLTG